MTQANDGWSKVKLKSPAVSFPADGLNGIDWECWLSDALWEEGRPAPWLTDGRDAEGLAAQGVYVWLVPRNLDRHLQILHVGYSWTSVLERLCCHLNNYFAWHPVKVGTQYELRRTDPLPNISPRDLATEWNIIAEDPNYLAEDGEIHEFLKRCRLLVFKPRSCSGEMLSETPKLLEGAIVRTAEHFLGAGQTTNTVRCTRRCKSDHYKSILLAMNSILSCQILPGEQISS